MKKTIGYKLTRRNMTTMYGMRWPLPKDGIPGKFLEGMVKPKRLELCQPGCLHFYDHPIILDAFRRAHVLDYERVWEVEAEGKTIGDGWKSGARRLRLLRELEMPKVTERQKVAFMASIFVQCLDGGHITSSKAHASIARSAAKGEIAGDKLERFIRGTYAAMAKHAVLAHGNYRPKLYDATLEMMRHVDRTVTVDGEARRMVLEAAKAADAISPDKPTAKKAKPKPTAKKSTRRPTKAKR